MLKLTVKLIQFVNILDIVSPFDLCIHSQNDLANEILCLMIDFYHGVIHAH